MKICPKCKTNKPNKAFYLRSNGKPQAYCKKCFSSYCMKRWIGKKKKAVEYKGGKCVDCKGTFEYFLYDFHHIDPTTKEFQWDKLRLYGWNRMKKELDKCIMVCANCHREIHYEEYLNK